MTKPDKCPACLCDEVAHDQENYIGFMCGCAAQKTLTKYGKINTEDKWEFLDNESFRCRRAFRVLIELRSLSALRSPAPAAPCPICGRVDDNHLHDVKHTAPAATVTGWRPVWGLLEEDEIIQVGDEIWIVEFDDWRDASLWIGKKSPGYMFRRRLTPPALTDEMRAVSDEVVKMAVRWNKAMSESNISLETNLECDFDLSDAVEKYLLAVAAVRGAGGEEVA